MKKNKREVVNFISVFLIVVVLISCISVINLIKFYVNDEVDYNEWNPTLGTKFETDIASTFCGKFQFVNLNGAAARALGQHKMNGIVKLNNGKLCTPFKKCEDENVLKGYADKMGVFRDYLAESDIPLLYVQAPNSISPYDNELPAGIEDYGNYNMDMFIADLKANDIDVMDMRQIIHDDGIDQYDMIYDTDHHWTTEAGFYAYTKISSHISEVLSCDVDENLYDIGNYTIENYPKWHLGSYGQRTGIYYAGIDDFDLIVPKFDTLLNDGTEDGDFCSVVVSKDALQNKDYKSRYTYDSVLGKSVGTFTNYNSLNDKKILLIADSYGKAVSPYMILTYAGVKCVSVNDVSMITKEYIEEYSPDMVVVLYYNKYLQEGYDSTFTFGDIN